MRIYALSDIHVDHPENAAWLENLSRDDYQEDILILAGDITDVPSLLEQSFEKFLNRFARVLYVPGNHDLWVHRSEQATPTPPFRAGKAS